MSDSINGTVVEPNPILNRIYLGESKDLYIGCPVTFVDHEQKTCLTRDGVLVGEDRGSLVIKSAGKFYETSIDEPKVRVIYDRDRLVEAIDGVYKSYGDGGSFATEDPFYIEDTDLGETLKYAEAWIRGVLIPRIQAFGQDASEVADGLKAVADLDNGTMFTAKRGMAKWSQTKDLENAIRDLWESKEQFEELAELAQQVTRDLLELAGNMSNYDL